MMLGCHWLVWSPGEEPECPVTVDFVFRSAELQTSVVDVCRVSGQLMSAVDGTPVRGQVMIPGAGIGAVTDEQGRYSLDLAAGLLELEASSLGAYPHRRLLWVSCQYPEVGPTLDFTLYPAVIQ